VKEEIKQYRSGVEFTEISVIQVHEAADVLSLGDGEVGQVCGLFIRANWPLEYKNSQSLLSKLKSLFFIS